MPQNNKDATKDLNVDELIGDAINTIDNLIKSENEKLNAMNGKTTTPAAKNENSPAPVQKDEVTGSPSPEASASAPPPEASTAPPESAPAPEASQPQDDGADLQGLVSSLDDGMLQELMQVVQMEMQARQSSQQSGAAPEQSSDNIAPAQEASQQMAPAADSAMKSELDEVRAKLAKSEENFANLQASVLTITETITKSASKPRPKAVTEIKDVQVVDRGEGLNKAEKGPKDQPSAADVHKKMNSIAQDRNMLSSLNKSEMDTLQGYLHNKQVNDKVLQLFNK